MTIEKKGFDQKTQRPEAPRREERRDERRDEKREFSGQQKPQKEVELPIREQHTELGRNKEGVQERNFQKNEQPKR